jgi:hypothetical protein
MNRKLLFLVGMLMVMASCKQLDNKEDSGKQQKQEQQKRFVI